ncbi:hypothetical protein PTI98_008724 [Pleurotus ostreatus]|nr:hypothetical protein PTI98_008724 [Pleurotus ostreatus]
MYTTVEKSFPIPNAAFDGAHEEVWGILKLISGQVGRISVGTLIPIQVTLAELELVKGGSERLMVKNVESLLCIDGLSWTILRMD